MTKKDNVVRENILIYREYYRAIIYPDGNITYEVLKHGEGFVPCPITTEPTTIIELIATICRDALKKANQLG